MRQIKNKNNFQASVSNKYARRSIGEQVKFTNLQNILQLTDEKFSWTF